METERIALAAAIIGLVASVVTLVSTIAAQCKHKASRRKPSRKRKR